MSNVIDYYTSFGDKEWNRLEREPLEFIVNWHYISKYLPASGYVLDNGAGPGKYSMELARKGVFSVTLTDLTPKFIEMAQSKALELGLKDKFQGFHVLNAVDLDCLPDDYYDASLMLGPLYHLQIDTERVAAVQELKRVTKKDGVVFVAFRSRINHILASLLFPENWKPNNTIDNINAFWQSGSFNHKDEGRYTGAYFYNVEDIKPFMDLHGFECIDLIGSTNIGASMKPDNWNYWMDKGNSEYQKLIDLLIKTAREPSVLGISSHLLYIGRKK